jgi:dUTP pyrophosphatase
MKMKNIEVKIKKISPEAIIPTYASAGSSGADLYSVVNENIEPGASSLISCGIAMEIPAGFEAQIRPRSGIALNNNVSILNTPGTIDSDYRGEIKVILKNFGNKVFRVKKGMRIAQMVFSKVQRTEFRLVEKLNESQRGGGGFGHTDE